MSNLNVGHINSDIKTFVNAEQTTPSANEEITKAENSVFDLVKEQEDLDAKKTTFSEMKLFDYDGNGVLNDAEQKAYNVYKHHKLKEEMLQKGDINKDGKIDSAEQAAIDAYLEASKKIDEKFEDLNIENEEKKLQEEQFSINIRKSFDRNGDGKLDGREIVEYNKYMELEETPAKEKKPEDTPSQTVIPNNEINPFGSSNAAEASKEKAAPDAEISESGTEQAANTEEVSAPAAEVEVEVTEIAAPVVEEAAATTEKVPSEKNSNKPLGIFGNLKVIAGVLINKCKEMVTNPKESVNAVANTAKGTVQEVKDGYNSVSNMTKTVADNVKEAVNKIAKTGKSVVAKAKEGVSNFKDKCESLTNRAKSGFDLLLSKFGILKKDTNNL